MMAVGPRQVPPLAERDEMAERRGESAGAPRRVSRGILCSLESAEVQSPIREGRPAEQPARSMVGSSDLRRLNTGAPPSLPKLSVLDI